VNNKFTRHNDKIHDPIERCEGTVESGQCPYNKIEGTNFCPMHGYNNPQTVVINEIKRNYQLRRFKERINDFADNDQIKSLREEIGILRMCMEEILNKCEDSTDLLMASHRIADLAIKIEKLVVSCDKLESRMGLLLSKRAVIQLATEYVQIINTYITDPEIIENISNKMIHATRRIEVLSDDNS
jgi:hypothetical protein